MKCTSLTKYQCCFTPFFVIYLFVVLQLKQMQNSNLQVWLIISKMRMIKSHRLLEKQHILNLLYYLTCLSSRYKQQTLNKQAASVIMKWAMAEIMWRQVRLDWRVSTVFVPKPNCNYLPVFQYKRFHFFKGVCVVSKWWIFTVSSLIVILCSDIDSSLLHLLPLVPTFLACLYKTADFTQALPYLMAAEWLQHKIFLITDD